MVAAAVPHAPGPAVRAAAAPPTDNLITAILARPLFDSTRRPPLPASAGGEAGPGLDDTRLTGIITEPGHRIAIFAAEGAKPLTVTEGETVSGWRIENITPGEISLSGPDGTKTLQPKFDPTQVSAPASPTANMGVQVAPGVQVPRPGMPVFSPRPPLRPGLRRER